MGLIREPKGVDFFVDPTPLTNEEKARISEIIAFYKKTGKKAEFKPIKSTRPISKKKHSAQHPV
jgi:hypothetical protein